MKILFVINKGSGSAKRDWPIIIEQYFKTTDHQIELYCLSKNCCVGSIQDKMRHFSPDRVIAVGGDGTVKLVASALLGTKVELGILPAGSANGMAKELKIPDDPIEALDVAVAGAVQKIHLIRINDQYCIHLSDIGFNAFMVKKFETGGVRGHWGYLKAAWKALWDNKVMEVKISTDSSVIQRSAAMIVLANATKFGTGALINPLGRLNDHFFEIIILKKISFSEIFKMMVTHRPYDTRKTELVQTTQVDIITKKAVHFQVDGEYLGKVCAIHAAIIPHALQVVGMRDQTDPN